MSTRARTRTGAAQLKTLRVAEQINRSDMGQLTEAELGFLGQCGARQYVAMSGSWYEHGMEIRASMRIADVLRAAGWSVRMPTRHDDCGRLTPPSRTGAAS